MSESSGGGNASGTGYHSASGGGSGDTSFHSFFLVSVLLGCCFLGYGGFSLFGVGFYDGCVVIFEIVVLVHFFRI